jgi:hypothetical protein
VTGSDFVITIGKKWRERQIYLNTLKRKGDKPGENKSE